MTENNQLSDSGINELERCYICGDLAVTEGLCKDCWNYDYSHPHQELEEAKQLRENWQETMMWARIERKLYNQVREEVEREREKDRAARG